MGTGYSVVGLGKLGASMAAAIASRGFQAIGVDVNQRAVDAINDGRAPVQETDLEATIRANRERIRATTSHREAILASDVTFVVVPTPSDDRGAFSLQYVAWAFREIGRALSAKYGYHNVVLTSTVLPGATRHGLLPILERESRKAAGRDFGLCYSPEFIALGSVIRDFLHPDFTLIGELDERCGEQLEACYGEIMPDRPACQRMSIENAELAKIAVNTYVTAKITFANLLAELCERIPGGDVDAVTRALGLDRRIGARYLTGALGYGGPCFPRDNVALSFIAGKLGAEATLPAATDRYNRSLPEKTVEKVRSLVQGDATVAILGLAYKPHSHVVEESQGVYLAKALARTGTRVVAYDPLAGDQARVELGDDALVLDSATECISQADVVVITTPDPAFISLPAGAFAGRDRPLTVIDCWRILDSKLTGQAGVRYVPVGRSTRDTENAQMLERLWGGRPVTEA